MFDWYFCINLLFNVIFIETKYTINRINFLKEYVYNFVLLNFCTFLPWQKNENKMLWTDFFLVKKDNSYY